MWVFLKTGAVIKPRNVLHQFVINREICGVLWSLIWQTTCEKTFFNSCKDCPAKRGIIDIEDYKETRFHTIKPQSLVVYPWLLFSSCFHLMLTIISKFLEVYEKQRNELKKKRINCSNAGYKLSSVLKIRIWPSKFKEMTEL